MLSPGELIDKRYLINEPLGQGGMAYVFKALDQHLDRTIALKILRPHLTDTDQERFRREIKTLSSLNHPGIVTIYDLGREEHIYFTMELVEGGLFTDLGPLETEPSSLQRFLQAAISVAQALVYVHQRGIVHRDLTPRNILLNAQLHPKVMDFGLVQLAESTRELTRTGLTLGTPQYMAPEQAQGELTGAHTDLYAFGAVLYKACTGVSPFEAENDQAILYQHVYGNLVPVRELNPWVPQGLEQLIHHLLAKKPEARPPSGLVVAEQLRNIMINESMKSSQQRLASPSQTGYYATGPYAKGLKLAWQEKLPEGPQWPASLTAGNGFLFIGLRSEEIQVRNPADGSLHARFEAPDEVNIAPLLLDSSLYYLSRDGSISALIWPSGKKRWTKQNAHVVGMIPAGKDLLLSRKQFLEKVSPDAKSLWRYECESLVRSLPIVHQLQAFIVTQEGWVHAVDALTGAAKYKIQVGDMAATPSAYNGQLYLPERSGELHAFDLESKEVSWTFDLESQLWASPICWQDRVYTVSWDGMLYCLSSKTGNEIWVQSLHTNVTATPVIAASSLFVATEQGELLSFDLINGKVLFRDKVSSSPIQASPLVFGDTVVVAALDGTLKAYRNL
ncbi:MAG: serine/threonine-protein kinase [Trueperaceae bacterium]|nr:serine/threonine-protein kinase [Trueperaceae bacterium]